MLDLFLHLAWKYNSFSRASWTVRARWSEQFGPNSNDRRECGQHKVVIYVVSIHEGPMNGLLVIELILTINVWVF